MTNQSLRQREPSTSVSAILGGMCLSVSFLISVICQIVLTARHPEATTVWNVLSFLLTLVCIVSLFIGRRGFFPPIAFGATAALGTVSFSSLLRYYAHTFAYDFPGFYPHLRPLHAVCELLADVLLFVLAVLALPSIFRALGRITRFLWFVPGVFSLVGLCLWCLYVGYVSADDALTVWGIVSMAFSTAATFLAGWWLTHVPAPVTAGESPSPSKKSPYFPLFGHILLLLFVGGIWQYIWIYRTTRVTNALRDETPRNPATKLLLCLFVPFYYLYWVYKTSQRIDRLSAIRGISSDSALTCLLFAIFLPIIAPILMQDKINTLAQTRASHPAQPTPPPAPQPEDDTGAQLKRCQALYKDGLITAEEYEAKRRQILGL